MQQWNTNFIKFNNFLVLSTNKNQLLVFAGVTILLSLTVFLNLVAETLPQVSDAIPLLGRALKTIQKQLKIIYLASLQQKENS